MFAPAFSKMREDVGRVTQKYPGNGENGVRVQPRGRLLHLRAVHAGRGRGRPRLRACCVGCCRGPSADDYRQRGQLPIFLPNYYPRRLEGVPAHGRPVEPAVQHGHRVVGVPLLRRGLCGLQRRQGGPGGEAAAAVGLAGHQDHAPPSAAPPSRSTCAAPTSPT